MPLQDPSSISCQHAVETIGPSRLVDAEWHPQQAPGSRIPRAKDARKVWAALDGWSKLTVAPDGKAGAVAHDVSLPDAWPVGAGFSHAWYLLRADPGPPVAGRLFLCFDAVAHSCAVFVNGSEAGRHLGGFTPFEVDITSLVVPGENAIALWVQDETSVMDAGRAWAISQLGLGGKKGKPVAGIWGGVYFELRQEPHPARVRIRTSTRESSLRVETWLRGRAPRAGRIRHEIYEWPDGTVPVLRLPDTPIPSGEAPEMPVEVSMAWNNPKFWSPTHPNLYVLRTTVEADRTSESLETRFGFREFWIEGKEFFLNGRPIRMFGDGDHRRELYSMAPGSALHYDRKSLEFLKREFHFNSIRFHGVIFPKWAAWAADEVGLLVTNQSALWSINRSWYRNASEELLRNLEPQFEEWYWRDVNSPSVVIWDVENEMIRDRKSPDMYAWNLPLDGFITKHDPDAIVQHSGAAYYSPDQQVIHVHMQEQYNRVLREWRASGTRPLVLGEFWMGGRGETRLPNSYEYRSREDWHMEEARIIREKLLEMRNFGVSGIFPHRITRWPLINAGALSSMGDAEGRVPEPYQWRFPSLRNQGAQGLAPVVGFVWPRHATEIAGVPMEREVVVCNDGEELVSLAVTCSYGQQTERWELTLGVAEQRRLPVGFNANNKDSELHVAVSEASGKPVDADCLRIHAIPNELTTARPTKRRVVVVPSLDPETASALNELQIPHEISPTLPQDASKTIVMVPPGAPADALGRSSVGVRDYLAAGGRLLVLPQHQPPAWLPMGLPFCTSLRTSASEFDRAGWPPTNRDLTYSRELPVYAPGHPALSGLEACDFKEWNAVDGRVSDDVFVRPNAAGMTAGCEYRVLLGATRRENASLIEFRIGAGTAILCQARVIEERNHPAARALLGNILSYLDGPAWEALTPLVGLAGKLDPSRMASLTALDAGRFVAVADDITPPSLILAGDDADTEILLACANAGSTVLVLSSETSGRLPGYSVTTDAPNFTGTRATAEDHPLFWGVASPSFLPIEQTPVRGALDRLPPDAQILMGGLCRGHLPADHVIDILFYGLETQEAAPPIAASQRIGKGSLTATTIEPWNRNAESHRQLLINLLSNAGVSIPQPFERGAVIEVKKTVPLHFDGALDDWTNDMEDDNLSEYCHAVPIALTSKECLEGTVRGDLDLSAILYLLHDDKNLYLGGILLSSVRDHTLMVEVELSGHQIQFAPSTSTLRIDGKVLPDATMATSRMPASNVIDSRLLDLTELNTRSGKAMHLGHAQGTTLEVATPWKDLGWEAPPKELTAVFRIRRSDGTILQLPLPDKGKVQPASLRLQDVRR